MKFVTNRCLGTGGISFTFCKIDMGSLIFLYLRLIISSNLLSKSNILRDIMTL